MIILVAILTRFHLLYPLDFFRCFMYLITFSEIWSEPFIQSMGIECSAFMLKGYLISINTDMCVSYPFFFILKQSIWLFCSAEVQCIFSNVEIELKHGLINCFLRQLWVQALSQAVQKSHIPWFSERNGHSTQRQINWRVLTDIKYLLKMESRMITLYSCRLNKNDKLHPAAISKGD